MSGKSFYDLDYIIEINEQRFEQYMSAYNELMGKLTNIVLIYSGMAIFLIPIVRNVFWGAATNWFVNLSFWIFAVFFSISVFNAVRFILPVTLIHLKTPSIYYEDCRRLYEQLTEDRLELEQLLKTSYKNELKRCLNTNANILERKYNFYSDAIIYALIALLPYLVCFCYHIANEIENGNSRRSTVKTIIVNYKK